MRVAALQRAAMIALVASVVLFSIVAVVWPSFVDAPAGDYQTRQGDILLGDGAWDAAIERFDAALAVSPQHRGALMGKAIALLQSGRSAEAEAIFSRLIDQLAAAGAADVSADDPDGDRTGRAVLAGAYANRGILRDRDGRHDQALADYRRALAIDAGAVERPGLMHRIIYGNAKPSSVAARAAYLERQLALPPDKRVLLLPEPDARQRMYKP